MTGVSHGKILATFENMRIYHPLLDEVHCAFDALREFKREAPFEEQKCITIFSESQAGKSSTLKLYIAKLARELKASGAYPDEISEAEVAKMQKVVLHLSLSRPASPKSLAMDILDALDDPFPAYGTMQLLLHRAHKVMRNAGTELVFVDEAQHLARSSKNRSVGVAGGDAASAVSDNLKLMLIRGLVPLVFVGTPDARPRISGNKQMSSRTFADFEYRMDLNDPASRKCFLFYLGSLGLELRDTGLFPEAADLISGDMPALLHRASQGLMGQVSNIICQAALRASDCDAPCVTKTHVVAAIREWAIPQNVAPSNVLN